MYQLAEMKRRGRPTIAVDIAGAAALYKKCVRDIKCKRSSQALRDMGIQPAPAHSDAGPPASSADTVADAEESRQAPPAISAAVTTGANYDTMPVEGLAANLVVIRQSAINLASHIAELDAANAKIAEMEERLGDADTNTDVLKASLLDKTQGLQQHVEGKLTAVVGSTNDEVARLEGVVALASREATTLASREVQSCHEAIQYLDSHFSGKTAQLALGVDTIKRDIEEGVSDTIKALEQGVGKQLAELKADMATRVQQGMGPLQEGFESLVAKSAQQHSALHEQLGTAVRNLGGAIDKDGNALRELVQKNDLDANESIGSSLAGVQERVDAALMQLDTACQAQVEEGMQRANVKMEVVETRVKTEIEPAIKTAVLELARTSNEIKGTSDRIGLLDSTMAENMTDGFTNLRDMINEMSTAVDMTSMLDALADEEEEQVA